MVVGATVVVEVVGAMVVVAGIVEVEVVGAMVVATGMVVVAGVHDLSPGGQVPL